MISGSVSYKRINDGEKALIPEEIRARLLGTKKWLYAAVDDSEKTWCAYLVITPVDGVGDMLQLQDLYVKPEYRGRYIGSELMERAFADAASAGAGHVIYKELKSESEQLLEQELFRSANGFLQISFGDKIDYYAAESIKENKRLEMTLKRFGNISVTGFKDYDDLMLKSFNKRRSLMGASSGNEFFDIKHSFFYTDNSAILMAEYVQIIRSFQAVIKCGYHDEAFTGSKAEIAGLVLACRCVKSVLDAGCSKIFIMPENERQHKNVTEILGIPDGVYYTGEWVKQLR